MNEPQPPLLEVSNLSITFVPRSGSVVPAVSSLSYSLAAGKTLAIVGESGSGKTSASRALMGLLPRSSEMDGSIRLRGKEYVGAPESAWRGIRGAIVAMVFQDPSRSLNPVIRVGEQIAESLRLHRCCDKRSSTIEALRIMDQIRIPSAAERFRAYPHQLSGGMRQRIAIAIAISGGPRLLIADECTRSLDPVTEQETLQLIQKVRSELGMAVIMIGHSLDTLASVADDMLVMHQGRAVEYGSPSTLLRDPQMPYTRQLRDAARKTSGRNRSDCAPVSISPPRSTGPGSPNKSGRVVLSVRDLTYSYPSQHWLARPDRATQALSGLSFDVREGEILGVVGENGAGKSTLAKALLQMPRSDAGAVVLDGIDLTRVRGEDLRTVRRHMQLVLQDPIASLNPRWEVARLVEEPLRGFGIGDRTYRARKVTEVLDRVRLPASDFGHRRPRELSGGQCQRVAIARALAMEPKLLICDEAVSTLDAIVQAQILHLLLQLRRDLRISIIFISHDLRLVRDISDRIAFLHHGAICDIGPTEELWNQPGHERSRAMIDAVLERPNLNSVTYASSAEISPVYSPPKASVLVGG